ncbi:DUF2157 domain-containing protein [Patescibacteria group bacterium]
MADQKLLEYIQTSLSEGKSKEEIYKTLLGQGWKIEDIEDIFEDVDKEKRGEDIQQRTIRIVVTIGALLVGLGVFSFVAANWQGMEKFLKVAIIVVSMVASYVIGWLLKEKWNYKKTGEAFILLGAIIYGAGIFLIGQMFNIRGNWPDGFMLWMIGTLIMAFAIDSFSLYFLSIPIAFIAISGVPSMFFVGFMRHHSFLFTSLALLLIVTAISFGVAFVIKKRMPQDMRNNF